MSDPIGRPSYANPPIEEGLCQFTFAEPAPWNVATPGQLYQALSKDYPSDPELQEQLLASLEGSTAPNSPVTWSMDRGEGRVIYKDASASRLIVANRFTLSANSLRPYEGWPALRQRMEGACDVVLKQLREPTIGTVSIRYINRIEIDDAKFNTDEYFTVPIRTAQNSTAHIGNFMYRVESIIEDETQTALVTLATLRDEANSLHGFLLDLEFKKVFPEPVCWQDAMECAAALKEMENAEFESHITDRTRELFI